MRAVQAFAIALCLAFPFVLSACGGGGGDGTPTAATGRAPTPKQVTLPPGGDVEPAAFTVPAGQSLTRGNVRFSCTGTTACVVTVNAAGKVLFTGGAGGTFRVARATEENPPAAGMPPEETPGATPTPLGPPVARTPLTSSLTASEAIQRIISATTRPALRGGSIEMGSGGPVIGYVDGALFHAGVLKMNDEQYQDFINEVFTQHVVHDEEITRNIDQEKGFIGPTMFNTLEPMESRFPGIFMAQTDRVCFSHGTGSYISSQCPSGSLKEIGRSQRRGFGLHGHNSRTWRLRRGRLSQTYHGLSRL